VLTGKKAAVLIRTGTAESGFACQSVAAERETSTTARAEEGTCRLFNPEDRQENAGTLGPRGIASEPLGDQP